MKRKFRILRIGYFGRYNLLVKIKNRIWINKLYSACLQAKISPPFIDPEKFNEDWNKASKYLLDEMLNKIQDA